jgi:hypothetical protein
MMWRRYDIFSLGYYDPMMKAVAAKNSHLDTITAVALGNNIKVQPRQVKVHFTV